ncbi:MAG: PAS domain S-box protein [Bacteroidales bacterium]|nr:PAS domain S-box protein [Bacteroidales bacterium]MCF8336552.1 PAS domain S-box protein [Bacteroidales bacterium]
MNTAHDLFLLMFNLTQVHDRPKIIEMFLDGLHEIFKPAVFQFTKENIEETRFDIEIKTRRSHFGFIRISEFKNDPKEHLPLIQSATQMLAVMLERLYFDRQLQEEKKSLEQIAEERNKDLQKKIKELEQAKNTSLNLVEDLQEEIKKRTQYEQELKESEERFRLVMENSLDAILITSPDGSILSANPAACNMFGMTQKEIYNAGKNGLVDQNDPNLPKLLAEREKTGKTQGELTFIRKDGTRFTAELSTSVFFNSKNELRTSMIIKDITEGNAAEKEILRAKEKVEISEERFRKTQEVGHIGSWQYDLQNDTFCGSEEAKKIYNLKQEKDEFTAQEGMQCVIEQDRDRINQTLIDLVNKHKTHDITFTIVSKNTSK